MAAKMQLDTLMAHMFGTGLLNDQFQQLQMLQDGSTPDFVADTITLYCEEGERIIEELAKLLAKPCVDFNKVDSLGHRITGSSACVGAERVKSTSIPFHKFCQEKSRDGCLMILGAIRNDFYDIHNKFQTMIELQQQIQTFYSKQ